MSAPFVIGEGLRGSVTRVWEKPTEYVLMYRNAGDFWQEFDTFKSFDAANLIMNGGKREYPSREWMVVKLGGAA